MTDEAFDRRVEELLGGDADDGRRHQREERDREGDVREREAEDPNA